MPERETDFQLLDRLMRDVKTGRITAFVVVAVESGGAVAQMVSEQATAHLFLTLGGLDALKRDLLNQSDEVKQGELSDG